MCQSEVAQVHRHYRECHGFSIAGLLDHTERVTDTIRDPLPQFTLEELKVMFDES